MTKIKMPTKKHWYLYPKLHIFASVF